MTDLSAISPELLSRYQDWLGNRNETPLLWVTAWDGAPGPPAPPDAATQWLDFPSRIARETYYIEHTHFLGAGVPHLHPNFGPSFLGACLGGAYGFDSHTFWLEHPVLDRLEDITRFPLREDNVWWRRVREYTALALERAAGRFLVAITDLGGGMDVLAGLRGSETLAMDLLDNPEGVQAALDFIYAQWWRAYDELADLTASAQNGITLAWNGVPAPGRTYIFQNDFSIMISPAQFREYYGPVLNRLCGRIEYGTYHLDGPGAAGHADVLCGVERLRAIQWIPGAGAAGGDRPGLMEWADLLRKIQAAGKALELRPLLVDVKPMLDTLKPQGLLMITAAGSPEEAREILSCNRI